MNLLKGSAPGHRYYLATTTPFTSVNGEESKTLDGVTYTRYFYVQDVKRTKCGIGDITNSALSFSCSPGSGNAIDPSTEQVTVVTSWPSGGNVTISRYLTRTANRITMQTDWSGGPTKNTGTPDPVLPATTISNQFYDSSNADYTSIPGAIQIQ